MQKRPASSGLPDWLLIAGALGLFLALTLPKALLVWRTGQFFDTDDAMRMVEVREWLAGASWFDRTQPRMSPPDGLSIHWSRLIDAALGGIGSLFALLLAPESAERAMRLAYPMALSALLLGAVIWLTRLYNEGRGSLAATVLTLCAVGTMGQFDPGRIDHHSVQIVLVLATTGLTAAALGPGGASWRPALAAGCLSALSLAISIENLPFLAVIAGAYGLAWGWQGRARAAALRAYALGLVVSSAALFVALVPQAAYGDAACDAFSVFHLTAAAGGALCYLLLSILDHDSDAGARRAIRLGAIAGAGLLLALALALTFPACFRDPLAAVDLLVRELWLSQVAEARPLWQVLSRRPDIALPFFVPIALGLSTASAAAAHQWRAVADAGDGRPWLLLAALLAAGLAATVWQIRAAASTVPLAIPAAIWAAQAITAKLGWQERPLYRLAPVVLLLPFAGLFWQIAIRPPARAQAMPSQAGCFEPRAFEALGQLPRGLLLSSVDPGSFLLAHTPHDVLAGAYHRNNRGNAAAISMFLAPPQIAQAEARARGVKYLAICPALVDVQNYAENAPAGLAATLLSGKIPHWLRPIAAEGSPYRIFEVLPP